MLSIRHTRPVLLVVLLATLLGVAFAPAATARPRPTDTSPNTTNCPYRVTPPKAIDTSEVPRPGTTSPTPLPPQPTPAGGPRMAECGYVLPPGAPPLPPHLGFESWVLMDLDTGTVLAAKDPHARQRPASIIKTLLSLVVLRDVPLNRVVTGTQEDANAEGTKVGIGAGGKYSVQTLLTGLLLKSGNDLAHALAMQLGGVPQAVDKMNAQARALGALDTRAATPSGLDGPGMCTSSYDMALIFRKALSDPRFAAIVHTRRMTFPGYAKMKPYEVANDNRLLGTYPGDLGGKTGFTDDAQHTYLNAAARDGHRVGLVMMRGENHLEGMYENAPALMDYGFALEARHTAPVGTLNGTAPQAAKPSSTATGAQPVPSPAASSNQTAPTSSGTSNWWLLIVALVVVAVALVLILFLRRRRTAAKDNG